MSDGFQNGGFTLKTIQMFSVHTTRRSFKPQHSPVILDLWSRKLGQGNDTMIMSPKFSKSLTWFSIFSLSTLKRKAGVFKFLRFKERFRKTLFQSRRISVDAE